MPLPGATCATHPPLTPTATHFLPRRESAALSQRRVCGCWRGNTRAHREGRTGIARGSEGVGGPRWLRVQAVLACIPICVYTYMCVCLYVCMPCVCFYPCLYVPAFGYRQQRTGSPSLGRVDSASCPGCAWSESRARRNPTTLCKRVGASVMLAQWGCRGPDPPGGCVPVPCKHPSTPPPALFAPFFQNPDLS